MATHSKKVSKLVSSPYQVFTNDTSVAGAVTFATGDYIDFLATLGRAAKYTHIILKGAIDVTLLFNTKIIATKFQEEQADTSVDMPEAVGNINSFRIFSAAGEEVVFETPEGWGLSDIKLVAYSGVASASTNLTVIGF